MASPVFFSDGHTPKYTDPQWRILQKILGALNDGAGGGGAAGGYVLHGAGVPVGSSPGTVTTQYTDDNTGLQYTLVSGNWI